LPYGLREFRRPDDRVTGATEGHNQFRQEALDRVLETICREGRFNTAIIATAEGLPIAAVSPTAMGDADTAAAMGAYLRDAAERTQSQLGLSPLDEIVIRDRDGRIVVGRSFVVAGGDTLILMVAAPTRRAYRRLTNIAILQISAIWQAGP
jgi:predicted regulator of Ras-like GTPase activity (Roadblock/LC7/MglB family)